MSAHLFQAATEVHANDSSHTSRSAICLHDFWNHFQFANCSFALI